MHDASGACLFYTGNEENREARTLPGARHTAASGRKGNSMGIREWIGVKQCRVEAGGCQTLEDLFVKIRDLTFAAGKPEIYRKEDVIAFPAIDDKNQVQIFGEKGRFMVIRSTMPTGMGWKEAPSEKIPATAGGRKKMCIELCQKTADQINALNL